MHYKFLIKKGFIAGLFSGIGSIVLTILSLFLPPAGCLWCIFTFLPGILAVYYVKKKIFNITTSQALITGTTAGLTYSLLTLIIIDPLLILIGSLFGGVAFFTNDTILTNILGGLGISMILLVIITSFLAIIIASIINAITALLYAIYNR